MTFAFHPEYYKSVSGITDYALFLFFLLRSVNRCHLMQFFGPGWKSGLYYYLLLWRGHISGLIAPD
jgi:hypothetical protein